MLSKVWITAVLLMEESVSWYCFGVFSSTTFAWHERRPPRNIHSWLNAVEISLYIREKGRCANISIACMSKLAPFPKDFYILKQCEIFKTPLYCKVRPEWGVKNAVILKVGCRPSLLSFLHQLFSQQSGMLWTVYRKSGGAVLLLLLDTGIGRTPCAFSSVFILPDGLYNLSKTFKRQK